MRTSINTRATRYKLLAVLLMGLLAFSMIPQTAFAAQGGNTIKVYIDFEGYNLGQGFYIEPTEIELPAGSTAGEATVQLLKANSHDYTTQGSSIEHETGRGGGFYLASVQGFGVGVPVTFPSYLQDYPGFDAEAALERGAQNGWLGEFDYTWMSGWMITVNNRMITQSAGAETVYDGDVIRWQFTVMGYGADLGAYTGWGADALYTHNDKSALYRALFAPTATSDAIAAGKAVIINPLASTAEITAAIEALLVEPEIVADAPILTNLSYSTGVDVAQTFSPDTYVYDIKINNPNNPSISYIFATATFDSSKYSGMWMSENGFVSYKEFAAVSGQSATLNGLRKFDNVITLRLTDKTDETNYTDYTLNIYKPGELTAGLNPADPVFPTSSLNGYMYSTYKEQTRIMFVTNSVGSTVGSSSSNTTPYRIWFAMPDVETVGLSVRFPNETAIRYKIGDDDTFSAPIILNDHTPYESYTAFVIPDIALVTEENVKVVVQSYNEESIHQNGGTVPDLDDPTQTYTFFLNRLSNDNFLTGLTSDDSNVKDITFDPQNSAITVQKVKGVGEITLNATTKSTTTLETLSDAVVNGGGGSYAVEIDGSTAKIKTTTSLANSSPAKTLNAEYTITIEEVETVEEVDKAELNAKIAEADGLTSALYTTATWSTLQTALGVAVEVSKDDEATQNDVNEALEALNTAISGLVKVNAYKITAPADATVKVFRQQNNYNIAVLQLLDEVENSDGTVTSWFATGSGTKHFRVSMEGKITKAGYFTSTTDFSHTVTFGEDEDPSWLGNNTAIANRDDANTLLNIPGYHNVTNLASVGDTFKLRSFRAAWQIIDSDVNNQMIEPDFNYKLLTGRDVVSIEPDENIPNWAMITALKEGTAIIEVSYDAIDIGGGTTSSSVTGRFGATNPSLKGLVVITVGDNGTGGDMTIEEKTVWDSEFDIFYTLEDADWLSVETSAGATITSSNPGAGKIEAAAVDGKVPVYPGNNIIKSVSASGDITYKVVRVVKLTPVFTPETPELGQKFTVKLDGLVMAVPKMSGIYNPNFSNTKLHMDGTDADVNGGQYTFSNLTVLTGTYTDGAQTIGPGYIKESRFGSEVGAHRGITDTGVGVNMGAPVLTGNLSVFPVIRLADYFGEIIEPEEITVNTWAQQDDSGFLLADVPLTVASDLSEQYGYKDEYNGEKVTALDALVATHIEMFGDDIADINDALKVNASGFITTVFYDDTSNILFYINGTQSGDGVYNPDPYMGGTSQTGYSFTEALLADGDDVLFAELQDDWGMDNFVWFEKDDEPVKAIEVEAGKDLELTLKGYMSGYGYSDPTWQALNTDPIKDALIVMVTKDPSGAAFFDGQLALTDEDGLATLNFAAPSTYYVSAIDDVGRYPLISPWLVITVKEAGVNVGAPGSGDLDGDGEVTMVEVLITSRYVNGFDVALDTAQLAAIDIDGDGEITMVDVIRMMRISIEL